MPFISQDCIGHYLIWFKFGVTLRKVKSVRPPRKRSLHQAPDSSNGQLMMKDQNNHLATYNMFIIWCFMESMVQTVLCISELFFCFGYGGAFERKVICDKMYNPELEEQDAVSRLC